jgi:predicted GNAT family acetyltransferase
VTVELWSGVEEGELMARAGGFLLSQPVQHNVILTMLADEPGVTRRYWAATDANSVVGVLCWHAGRPPVLAAASPAAAAAMAETLARPGLDRPLLPGVVGEETLASAFSETWTELTATKALPVERRILYYLRRLNLAEGVAGHLRPAEGDDIEWLTRWLADFSAETGTNEPTPMELTAQLRDHRLWLWRHDKPVAMAGLSTAIGGISRLRNVYTPLWSRGKGYALALVGHLSSRLLDNGYRCIAYGDTSDRGFEVLCERVGYAAVAEHFTFHFEPR